MSLPISILNRLQHFTPYILLPFATLGLLSAADGLPISFRMLWTFDSAMLVWMVATVVHSAPSNVCGYCAEAAPIDAEASAARNRWLLNLSHRMRAYPLIAYSVIMIAGGYLFTTGHLRLYALALGVEVLLVVGVHWVGRTHSIYQPLCQQCRDGCDTDMAPADHELSGDPTDSPAQRTPVTAHRVGDV